VKTEAEQIEIRDAVWPDDRDDIERLWLAYLTWGNDEMEARHGFRLPVREAVDQGLAAIGKFHPPDGRLVLAVADGHACGIGCLQRIGTRTAEVKRMFVEPEYRRGGLGRRILRRLITAADAAGYERIRLDSPDFMAAAHALYRAHGFVDIAPYPESEIPDRYKEHWVFMERSAGS
jgi:GNAT superfamily N-acetyltransferase